MRSSDLVLAIASTLPKLSDLFSDNFNVVSVATAPSGPDTEVTIETNIDHGFLVDQGVNVVGAETPIAISSFTRVGTIGTIITQTDHDFTFGLQGGALSGSGAIVAKISGANESEFNGNFQITGVINRREIQVSIDDSGASSASGSLVLENGSSKLQSYNGLKRILTVPTPTTFTYLQQGSGFLPPVGNIFVKGNARVSSSVSIEKIIDAYTKQTPNRLWFFVVLEDVTTSKDRKILSDATSNTQRANHFRQQIIQPVSFYVVFPTSTNEIAGRQSRDVAEELFRPICQSVLFKRFDSLLYNGKYNPLQFISHGLAFYNSAFYIHQYVFQQVADLQFEDTVGFDDDFAFRDIFFDMENNLGIEKLTANIDLDQESL